MTPAEQPELPKYHDLPEVVGGVRSGWHVFGADDQLGRINLQTADRIAAAARLVETGQVFSLNAPFDAIDPPMFGRAPARHVVVDEGTGSDFDDYFDGLNPQASSQWDSLAHVGFAADVFYNGATAEDVRRGRRNTVEHWARRGIIGRGVLLDIEAVLGGAGDGFDPGSARRVSVAELDEARSLAGIEWRPGDVMILHTGYLEWYLRQDRSTKERIAAADSEIAAVGLDRGPEMLAYLWDSGAAAVGADNPAVESGPFDPSEAAWPFGFLHNCLIGQLGMALGELWWLGELARSCRTDGRYEFLFTAAPSHVAGGIGSPANALAIK